MKEIDGGVSIPAPQKSLPPATSSESMDTPVSGANAEDGNAKERAVARAALSIAELCTQVLFHPVRDHPS